uniref:Uncharacterized protein n=1 Tax=Nothoprocta perdicaria TaxID=30464 RepID=A0A8C7EHC9_NOTPE
VFGHLSKVGAPLWPNGRTVQFAPPWLLSLPACFYHSHLVFTHILATVPSLKALFVSFTFLVWIILKYEIHL